MSPSSIIKAIKERGQAKPAVQPVAKEAPAITKADVEPGDILLLHYVPEKNVIAEMLKLLKLARQAVEDWKHWGDYDQKTREEHFSALMPLIHFAITAFDNNHFFHAAIIGKDTAGDKVVIEAGPKGIMQTPFSNYWDGPISVLRYHKGAISLGDKLLPAEPVLKKASSLYERGDIEYGYFHAGLLAVWCLFRSGEDSVMDRLHAALVLAFGAQTTDMLFKLIGRETIRLFLVDIFHKALDRWRQDKHLVCSEMVAACFNQADGLGTYTISRKLTESQAGVVEMMGAKDQAVTPELEAAARELAGAFEGLEIDRPLRAVDVALALVSSDVLYTPSDLERSVSTFTIGKL